VAVLPKPTSAPVTAREIFTRLGISSPTPAQRASLWRSLARLAKRGRATRFDHPRTLPGWGYLWRAAKRIIEEPLSSDEVFKARKLLEWDQKKLAGRARVSQPTISRLECGFRLSEKFEAAVRDALKKAVVEFNRRNRARLRR
jgi:DNA-binding XRE family transcriptional regulator